ncbi:MAG TPA: glutamine--tRNA ligase/YqeY domain fusion protein [Saprospiraceae bacterium]|nr:glutamine--tRNA ligase/YqeY domain fusion protein [Saprospiraceae bacterium]
MEHIENKESLNFLEDIIEHDLKEGKNDGRVLTRFPPEPNGYLHIGHATAICLNFGIAKKYGGSTNLRFDDTNPITEETEYVESIRNDVKWLGFNWANEFFASDYFDQLYDYAIKLIKLGLAYVDDSSAEEIAEQKGTPTEPGKPNKFRSRSIEENLQLFIGMKDGLYADGERVLRAKIDMLSSNMLMRDPIIYRIKHAHHHRTADKWCIYPMYDFAHGQSDSIEQITHSICTLEFVPHREVYDWFIEKLEIFPSKQYEFARRNLSYTVMSKRKLLLLVNESHVSGWDDPRMPTISGLRRRGYTSDSIREFCDKVGIAKRENLDDVALLEFCLREDLNKKADRVMGVMNPVKVVISNYNGAAEVLKAENNPDNPEAGHHDLPFGNVIYIEKEDFMVDPPKGYFRLFPGNKVRLKYAYIIEYESHKTDAEGNVTEIEVRYYSDSKSGEDQSGIKVKTALHWVPENAIKAEVRLYDRLFTVENPMAEKDIDFKSYINPNSLIINDNALVEPYLKTAELNKSYQFFRLGYFCLDKDSSSNKLVFNKTVSLKDSWGKTH